MKKILGIEVTNEEFDCLFCQQSLGKELKVENGKVIAREHIISEEEKQQHRISEIQQRLNNLSQDFVQADLGAIFEDLEQRKEEFRTLHNEMRVLLNKEPRVYEVLDVVQ